jgi:serine protease SohB
LQVTRLNEFYKELRERLESGLLDKASSRPCASSRPRRKSSRRKKPEQKRRVFVLDFDGDIKASATESLRNEITALLTWPPA